MPTRDDRSLPFKLDVNDLPEIIAAKSVINSMFLWKEVDEDDDGKPFDFEKQSRRISRALALLTINRKVTHDESMGIINHLSREKMGLVA